MKKLLVLLMAVLLVLSAVPASTFAIDKNDKEFEAFLKDINWSKKDYIDYLESKDWTLDSYEDSSELGTPLTEKGVQAVMAEFELTRAELNSLLVEYGEIEEGQDVLDGMYLIFTEDLRNYVEYYLEAGIDENDPEFLAFLKEIGWSKEDYVAYLASKDWSLEDYWTVDELGTPITEKGIQEVLAAFELTRAELNALFAEYGEIEEGEDIADSIYIIFHEDLVEYTEFYLDPGIDENDPEFLEFLTGIDWTKEDYISYLVSKGQSLDDYWYVDELGTPLTEEGVQAVMAEFDLTREELNGLLVKFGDIEKGEDVLDGIYIIFTEDLQYWIEYYLDEDNHADIDFGIEGLFEEIGLTDEELERIFDHLLTLDIEDEAYMAQIDALLVRIDAIEDFESAEDLDAAQIAEILDIFTQLIDLFELEMKYYLTDGTDKQPLTLAALMTLETTNGMDLLIEVYNTQGTFLADMIFTAEMFGSEIIKDTGKDLEVISDAVTAPKPAAVKKDVKVSKDVKAVKTVKGGKLPKTASDYGTNALIGLAFVLAGFILFRRLKTAGN